MSDVDEALTSANEVAVYIDTINDQLVDTATTCSVIVDEAAVDLSADTASADTASADKLTENICCICMYYDATITLRNCNHKVICKKCYKKIDKCPICRAEIKRASNVGCRLFLWLFVSAIAITIAFIIIPVIDNANIKIFVSLSVAFVWALITVLITELGRDYMEDIAEES